MSKVISRLLWFCFTSPCDWLAKLAPFFNQWEGKLKPIVPRSHAFSRAWRRLHVFALSSDWPIVLFTFVLILQDKLLWFWFYDTQLKTALIIINIIIML